MKPMLLTDCQDPEALLRDPEWYMQEKLDGDRMMLSKVGNAVRAWSRNGERTVPETVLAVALISESNWTLDGELMPGGEFVVFNTVGAPVDALDIPFTSVRIARTEEEKFALFHDIRINGGEGVVFKRKTASYVQGTRTENWQRWKFYESDDFTVGEVNLAKCSFDVWRGGKCYGRVACGLNRLPKQGDVVRVRYDRITEKGKLLRATLHK